MLVGTNTSAIQILLNPVSLSAYLNKLKECANNKEKTCEPWTNFARNIAIYVKKSGKKNSNMFRKNTSTVKPDEVTFDDFVDYIIHMYLRNDGKINSPITDVSHTNSAK